MTVFFSSTILGAIMIILGIRFTTGYFRIPLLNPTLYTNFGYGAIPFGLAFITMGLMGLFPYPDSRPEWLTWIMIVLIVIGVIFNLAPPRFLTPDWYLLIRSESQHMQELLFEDARMNYKWWKENTKSKKEVEIWIAGVKSNHNL